MVKQVLGRGLGALLGNPPAAAKTGAAAPMPSAAAPSVTAPVNAPSPIAPVKPDEQIIQVALDRLRPCPLQPRKDFPPETLTELADSIKAQGIIQPLVARADGDGYQLIAGERRWRAAQMLKLPAVPVLVRKAGDREVLELMLIENLQRENLNPIEEALGYAELIDQFQVTQEVAAAKVGKSRAAVANALRLLKLPPEVQAWIKEGRLSAGHAKVLLGLASPEEQRLAGEKVLHDGLTVRQLEELVALWQNRPKEVVIGKKSSPPTATRDVHVVDMEDRLQQRFGTKVSLRYRKGKGSVDIRFYSDAELERILDIAGINMD